MHRESTKNKKLIITLILESKISDQIRVHQALYFHTAQN